MISARTRILRKTRTSSGKNRIYFMEQGEPACAAVFPTGAAHFACRSFVFSDTARPDNALECAVLYIKSARHAQQREAEKVTLETYRAF
jgi:hypothetical protein